MTNINNDLKIIIENTVKTINEREPYSIINNVFDHIPVKLSITPSLEIGKDEDESFFLNITCYITGNNTDIKNINLLYLGLYLVDIMINEINITNFDPEYKLKLISRITKITTLTRDQDIVLNWSTQE